MIKTLPNGNRTLVPGTGLPGGPDPTTPYATRYPLKLRLFAIVCNVLQRRKLFVSCWDEMTFGLFVGLKCCFQDLVSVMDVEVRVLSSALADKGLRQIRSESFLTRRLSSGKIRGAIALALSLNRWSTCNSVTWRRCRSC